MAEQAENLEHTEPNEAKPDRDVIIKAGWRRMVGVYARCDNPKCAQKSRGSVVLWHEEVIPKHRPGLAYSNDLCEQCKLTQVANDFADRGEEPTPPAIGWSGSQQRLVDGCPVPLTPERFNALLVLTRKAMRDRTEDVEPEVPRPQVSTTAKKRRLERRKLEADADQDNSRGGLSMVSPG